MDRVLLIIDDIQYNRQVEMTLRKLGFEVESVNNEFNVNEPLLSFNPDYIIVRGNSNRLNVLNVGKKLYESSNLNNGKVILIFPENTQMSSEDLFKIRADIVLTEPISTLRLMLYLITLTNQDAEFIKEKLMKYAVTDSQFRIYEQQLLRNAGITVDSEIELLTNLQSMQNLTSGSIAYFPDHETKQKKTNILVPEPVPEDSEPQENIQIIKEAISEVKGELAQDKLSEQLDERSAESLNKLAQQNPEDFQVTDETQERVNEEILLSNPELPLRIDAYNRAIKNINQDLKIGLKKRQTKKEFNKLHKDLLHEKKTDKKLEDNLDNDRIKFAKALFDKKKE